MELLYGTWNEGKLLFMKRSLEPLGITLKGLKDMGRSVPKAEETGSTPLENARIKARTYYEAFQVPVFSCDTGLYLEEIPEELQPGVYVRRIQGHMCTDEEMTAYYSGLARRFGDLKGQYRNAICYYRNEQEIYESEDRSLWGLPFLITHRPHPRTQKGFPIDRLAIQIASGKYYYDLLEYAQDEIASTEAGIREFFGSLC